MLFLKLPSSCVRSFCKSCAYLVDVFGDVGRVAGDVFGGVSGLEDGVLAEFGFAASLVEEILF